MSTALTERPKQDLAKMDLKRLLSAEQIKDQVAKVLPSHLKPDRFLRVAMTALTRTPKLMECTQPSFMKCLLDLSAYGLEPDGRRAHLIPYGKECTLIIDYKGLAELAMRSGIVANIHADVVCENDAFKYSIGEVKEHVIDFRNPRGEVYAVYAICRFKDGTTKADCMTREDVDKIRKRSRAGASGPWQTDWNEMAKKTVFRRLSKWLPLSAEFRDAVERDDEELEQLPEREVTPKVSAPKFLKQPADAAPSDFASGFASEDLMTEDKPEGFEPGEEEGRAK